ncbi:MAG: hypothetical protein ACJARR_003426 [Pseudophaeobacter arcticus]|jgi:hypothetical protein
MALLPNTFNTAIFRGLRGSIMARRASGRNATG